MRRDLRTNRIQFRSIEEDEIKAIHKHQNTDCIFELSGELDLDLPWAPATLDQIKAKLEELQKKERTAISAIYSNEDEFVGIAVLSAEWDTWNPHMGVTIWPEHRRKCFGTEVAKLLLEIAFDTSVAHVVNCGMPDFNKEGLAFAESLGFKNQGAERRAGVMDGKFFDYVLLDMLRDEYLELYPKGGEG
jgi:RimJ/RimL family protein N-acetyltransferase